MSRLAHSNQGIMDIIEIRRLYDELSEPEFFEAMDAGMMDECLIDQALGAGVVQEFANWIYLNLK
jgi:hypothetical protein